MKIYPPYIITAILILLFTRCNSADKEYQGIYEGEPRINSPYVTGNYPNTPFLFYIPTAGERPVKWSANNLPEGLSLDSNTGIIRGTVEEAGDYRVELIAENKYGSTKSELTISIGDKLLLTPPMGWNSWNTFGENLDGKLIMEVAEAMIRSGMRDVGYTYINIDDFWQLTERGEDGHIQIDKEKFPNGIKAVADYLHERGFKLGIYSDAADRTCGGVCGSYGFEKVDAADFAEWGVDLLKYDYCNAPQDKQEAIKRYEAMGNALKATKRSIVYSICEWGQLEPWDWAEKVGGHYWRTTFDIRDKWYTDKYSNADNGILNIIELNAPLAKYAKPGAWNDPDMLVVGISGNSQNKVTGDKKSGCTDEQYRTHMSMWSMMAAPLLAGNDVRNMDSTTISILTNPEIIAINQDILGKQAERIVNTPTYQIWRKPLVEGKEAIACFNTTENVIEFTLDENMVASMAISKEIRDVWAHKNIKVDSKKMNIILRPYQCGIYIVNK